MPKRLYEQTFSATTLSAAVDHHWSDGLMTYARYAQGFKGGGWNAFFAGAVSQESLDNFHSFDEERALSWEVGFKTNLPDRGLRLQGAIFTTDYRDMQFVYRLGPAPLLLNAGKATISGAEIEGAWTPTPSWRIQGGIGYLKDRIRSISQDFALLGATTAVTTEHELPYTPAMQATLGLGYAFGLRGYSVLIHSDVSRRGRTFFDAINTREIARLDDVRQSGRVPHASIEDEALAGRHRRPQRDERGVSHHRKLFADNRIGLCGGRLCASARVQPAARSPVRVVTRLRQEH